MDKQQITRIPLKYLPILETLGYENVGKIFINILGGNIGLNDMEKIYFNLIITDVDAIDKKAGDGNKGGRPPTKPKVIKEDKPMVSTTTKPSIDKASIDKTRIDNKYMFEKIWSEFPHARTSNKKTSKENYYKNTLGDDEIMQEIKLLKRKIEIGDQDTSWIKSMELRIRDIIRTQDIIKNSIIKKIVYYIMDSKNKELSERAIMDFGFDVVEIHRKERSNERNGIVLKLT